MTGLEGIEYIKLAIYYVSFLYFPAVAVLIFVISKKRGATAFAGLGVLLLLSILAYARFVEPRILIVKEHALTLDRCFPKEGAVRLTVFSDTHNGLFGNAMGIDRIASRVEKTKPDAVLIAGDFVYFLHPDRMADTFAALGEIAAPVIGVFGNHDIGLPGPDLKDPLEIALEEIGVRMIDDQSINMYRNGQRLEIVGISDLWADEQRLDLLEKPASHPRFVLTHNPATVQHIKVRSPVDLLIAGHTHGAQIYIPFVSCQIVKFACRIQRYGFSREKRAMVFVTSGTGMVGLPMRFNAPPRIDVLNIRYKACPAA